MLKTMIFGIFLLDFRGVNLEETEHGSANPAFPIGNTASNGGCSIAMLVYRREKKKYGPTTPVK